MEAERAAKPGEACTCGRQAVIVFATEFGEVGWCGASDGGRRGPCDFCGDPAGHEGRRCGAYTLQPTHRPAGRPAAGPAAVPEAEGPAL